MNRERPYDISPEPLWCEDCKHFCNADMGGEGECDIDNHDTWYGCPICEKAELKCGKVKKQTNYDRIRNMSVEEMAEFMNKCGWDFPPYCDHKKAENSDCDQNCLKCAKEWLEAEVTE